MNIDNVVINNSLFLAPMAGITDTAFRIICKEQGCGMVYTEMVSAKGLFYGNEKTEKLMELEPEELPGGVQIFGSDPLIMAKMAEKISESQASIIDINMGCPAPKIVKNGEGSALMKNPQLVKRIVREVKKVSTKPVTVKIRKGWDDSSVNAVEIARIAEGEGASAITVHGRTREQFYAGKADWDIIKQVKDAVDIPVIGNGDIFTPEDACRMLQETNCDGIMIARGAQGNPWLFSRIIEYSKNRIVPDEPSPREKITTAIRHLKMIVKYKGEKLGVLQMRKHIPWYIKGLRDCIHIKGYVNKVTQADQMEEILLNYLEELE